MKWIKAVGCCLLCLPSLWGCHSSGNQHQPQTDTVIISGMKFQPANLVVHKGDTVLWINKGIVKHNVTTFPAKEWTSGKIAIDSTWAKVVTDSISYFCSIHPTMKGKIVIRNHK